MTDSSDPRRPKSSRRKPAREPATLDLQATVIDDGANRASPEGGVEDKVGQGIHGEEARAPEAATADTLPGGTPDETIPSGSEPPVTATATPETTLDSGMGTDTLPSGDTTAQETIAREPSASEGRAKPMPSPAAPEPRSSAGALIGAGLIGGLIGAGALYGLQAWQASTGQTQPVELRLAQLEQRVGALRQPAPAAPAQGNAQALEGRIQALETARGELDRRLQALQNTAGQAAAQAQEALSRPLPEAPAPQASPENEAALADLSSRLSSLEEQMRANAQSAANAAVAAQDLDRRIADLDRQLSETGRRFAEADRRIGEQEQRFSALSRQAAESTRTAEAASQTGTRVVLAGRLNDALNSGAPYAEVLDGVRKAGADPARLAPLEPFAQQGAPTAAALAQSFEPVETAILRESRGPAESWTDRLLRMADKVVTVRPMNEPGATGVPAQVARIRQALERGDVVEAAAAWDALPEPSRRLSEEWGRQLKAVAEAHRAAQGLSSDALATLNRPTQ